MLARVPTDRSAAGSVRTCAPHGIAGERQTQGCGAGVVELTWSSDSPVQLRIYSSNIAAANSSVVVPASSGQHSLTSDTHTLTWSLEDDTGAPSMVRAVNTCSFKF
jgi:hypothetical protein